MHAQQITSTTLLEGNVTCAGDMVVLTCETVGSDGLAWRSNDYIGTGGTEISFLAEDISDRLRKYSTDYDTYAILTDVTNEGGKVQLESELHLTVTVNKTFTVTCVHVDQYLMESITFHISTSGKYYITLLIYYTLSSL